jgi:hypothetical protein
MTTPPGEDEARVREVGLEVRQATRERNRLRWEHPFPRTGRVLHARAQDTIWYLGKRRRETAAVKSRCSKNGAK